MSLFGDCAVKRAKYKPTTSALREYGICGFRAPDEDRDATTTGSRAPRVQRTGGYSAERRTHDGSHLTPCAFGHA